MYLFDLYCKIEFWILRKVWWIKFWSIWIKSQIKYWLYGDTKKIHIWDYVYIWENCNLWWMWWINIGNGSIIAPNVIIRSSNHDYKSWDYLPYWPWVDQREVIIWDNCWVWANVLITPGTQVWEGSIIGFWAVLSWIYPPFSIIVWNPGKVIKSRDIQVYERLKQEQKIYFKHFDT